MEVLFWSHEQKKRHCGKGSAFYAVPLAHQGPTQCGCDDREMEEEKKKR